MVKRLTGGLSFTVIGERKAVLLCKRGGGMVNDTKERIPDAAADRVIACYEARSDSP